MDAGKLRMVFIGMSRFFTRAPLRAVAARCSLVGVIESGPADFSLADGGTSGWSSHLKTFASHRGVPHFLLRRGGERAVEFLRRLHPDVVCVACCEQLLRREEFEIPALGAINLHPSLLPRYRGPNPYFWQSHQMDLEGGVTIHQIDEGIDTGDILLQRRFPIRPGASFLEVFQASLRAGSDAMVRALELLVAGEARAVSQKHLPCPLYARIVKPGEQLVDWDTWPIERAWHFLRGTQYDHPCLAAKPGFRWSVGAIEPARASVPVGTIGRDGGGHYLAHGEGKIRLGLHRHPNLADRLLRPPARRLRRAIEWW
jgi:methionyl-tRNA formyltransferase